MQDNWEQNLKAQHERGFKNYQIVSLDLGTAHVRHPVYVSGDYLYVEELSSGNVQFTVRLNRDTNEAINLGLHRGVETIFEKFFITNTAQAGQWVNFLVGINFKIVREPAGRIGISQAAQVITNVAANTNTPGAAYMADRVLLKADVENAGIVWIDFRIAAVQQACLPLDPGDWSRHRVQNCNQINANFEIANERLIVIPEV